MAKIRVLPEHIVNKIAAGEVVERPASVVKELLENSIDARATRIAVEVEDGGRKLIRISDNGGGMGADDLALAFTPHATSKIERDDDLFSIRTMGFRGEALASIASISQVEIVSRPAEGIEGARLEIAGGKSTGVTPAAASPGTSITVRNLFFNTPARRKFLRTANTEMGHISEQFTRIALVHTEMHLSLTHNGRLVHELPAGQSLTERIGMLFSGELAESLFAIGRKEKEIEINGLIAHPQQSRTGSQWQHVFLNGRHIRDRFISHAIREAYRGMIEINRQPVVFLFLTMPPENVDVNVHPAKTEVRFSNSNLVHSQVLAAIRDRLLGSDLTVGFQADRVVCDEIKTGTTPAMGSQDAQTGGPETELSSQAHQHRVRQAMADFFKSVPSRKASPNQAVSSGSGLHPENKTAMRRPSGPLEGIFPPAAGISEAERTEPLNAGKAAKVVGLETTSAEKREVPPHPEHPVGEAGSVGEAVGPVVQIHNTYLVMQTVEGMVIIDQHALHERILYEKLSDQLNQGPLTSQRRLIPEVVEVMERQMAVAENQQALLEDLGIQLEPFGPHSLAVQGFPVLLEKASPEAFVRDLLDLLSEQAEKATREELIHHVLDMMACKAAVKAGDPLTEGEIRALLAQRHLIEQSGTCPHGRPTTLRLSLAELERQFKRT